MNFFDADENRYLFSDIEKMANQQKISLRTGCFCNPGLDETISQVTRERLHQFVSCNMKELSHSEVVQFFEKERGSVRVSLGYVSNFHDVNAFLIFAGSLLNQKIKVGTLSPQPVTEIKKESQMG